MAAGFKFSPDDANMVHSDFYRAALQLNIHRFSGLFQAADATARPLLDYEHPSAGCLIKEIVSLTEDPSYVM